MRPAACRMSAAWCGWSFIQTLSARARKRFASPRISSGFNCGVGVVLVVSFVSMVKGPTFRCGRAGRGASNTAVGPLLPAQGPESLGAPCRVATGSLPACSRARAAVHQGGAVLLAHDLRHSRDEHVVDEPRVVIALDCGHYVGFGRAVDH